MKTFELKKEQTHTIIENIDTDVFEKEYVVGKNSQLTLVLLISRATNTDVRIRLADRGSHAHIVGFVEGEGDRKTYLRTLQLHEAPETTSNLLVKSVLSDSSYFSYDGGIEVVKNAQKTDAYQRNENILLSKMARAESKPKLEILANDVRCTHGATTGMLSAEELWYLSTRGIGNKQGQRLLIDGFFEHAIATLPDSKSQEDVRKLLWKNT